MSCRKYWTAVICHSARNVSSSCSKVGEVMSEVPSTASAQPDPVPPAVTDRRPVPRGVLPRGVQTWIMAGIAAGMLAIMLIVGRPDPPPRPAQAATPAQTPSADRVRDYQDR